MNHNPENANGPPTHLPAAVRLDQLDLEALCHEDLDAVLEDDMDEILCTLLRHGPPARSVEFYLDEAGRAVVIRGQRWLAGCRILAAQGAPGFASEMVIDAVQVLIRDPKELLLRSADDPVVRYRLDYDRRLRLALRLDEASIPAERAAAALAIPVESYIALVERARQLEL